MRRRLGAVLLVVAMGGAPAELAAIASHAYVAVFEDEAASTCEFTGGGSGVRQAYAVLTNSIPLTSVTFQAPIPSGFGSVFFESSPYQTTGDSQNGITVGLGGCTSAPVTLLTVFYNASGPQSQCYWPAHGVGGGEGSPFEFVDCDGVTRGGHSAVFLAFDSGGCCEISHGLLAPYHPWPPDGATEVPVDLTLTWGLPGGEEEGGWPYVWMQLDDEPLWDVTPPGKGDYGYWTSYTPPEPLTPHTTYYWRVYLLLDFDDGVRSDTWTFTTGDATVPTQAVSWGRIKALYRP